jgi:hypothetical protein
VISADIEAVIRKAEAQLGVVEKPSYSNRTPYTAWYGLVGPWCAMFVSWVFHHAGHPLPKIRTTKGFAYCPDIVAWAKRNGTWRPSSSGYTPKRGDIVLFDFIGRPSHVGIVTGLTKDGRVATIEGNTNAAGSRTGGAVMRHNRSRRGSTIGYVEVTNNAPPTTGSGIPHDVLRRGDTGPKPAAVQWTLRFLGFVLAVDGDFGDETERQARAFQQACKDLGADVEVDGRWGPQTAALAEWWTVAKLAGMKAA